MAFSWVKGCKGCKGAQDASCVCWANGNAVLDAQGVRPRVRTCPKHSPPPCALLEELSLHDKGATEAKHHSARRSNDLWQLSLLVEESWAAGQDDGND